MGFFTLQELTYLQMTCYKLGDEGQKGWVSWLWDQHSPVTLLLLPSLYPAQWLVQNCSCFWKPELTLQESRNPLVWDTMLMAWLHTPASYRLY